MTAAAAAAQLPAKIAGAPTSTLITTTGRSSSCRPAKAASNPAHGVLRMTTDEHGLVMATKLGAGGAEILPTRFPGTTFTVSTYQHMGDRRTQEDRFAVVPTLEPGTGSCASFFGVFDGTVGDFASENVKDIVVPKLLEAPSWRALRHCRPGEQEKLLENAVREMYKTADDALLARCSKSKEHYATCTSVTLLIVGEFIVVGHLGDSRIILGKDDGSPQLVSEQLTADHKPNLAAEKTRIEQCGGMVEKLQNHSNKPFIRGGDFMMRKALGEQPMQLQYSRAFGGKDLKIFGLSNVPDVRIIRAGSSAYRQVRWVILATDGLWDVLTAQQAVNTAQQAAATDNSPAKALVELALLEQSRKKARADNITALCIQFE